MSIQHEQRVQARVSQRRKNKFYTVLYLLSLVASISVIVISLQGGF